MAQPAHARADSSRREALLAGGGAAAALSLFVLAFDRFQRADPGALTSWISFAGFVVALAVAFAAGPTKGRIAALRDGLMGASLVGAAAALRQVYPPSWPALTILALGFALPLGARSGAVAARLVAGTAFLSEVVLLLSRDGASDVPSVLGLACALAAVPMLLEATTRASRREAGEAEEAVRDAVAQRLRALDEDARQYRLIAATTRGDLPAEVREQRRRVGSVQTVRETTYGLLQMTSRMLEPHTCALFLLDGAGTQVKVRELISRSDFVVQTGLPTDKGVLGSVVKKKESLALRGLRADFPGVTWYHPPIPVAAVVAVPVMEGEHLRGVLLCDWLEDREVGDRDKALLASVAREVMRAVETEQLFASLDREKDELDGLYKVSHDFIGALTLDEAFRTTLRTARKMSGASVAVLLLKEEGALRIAAVDGLPDEAAGHEALDETGLLSTCMGHQTIGPQAAWEPARLQQMLGAKTPLADIVSVRTVPFRERGQCLGVLLIGGTRNFPRFLDDRLQMVADMASIAVSNARLYARMEKMATTDGLTGLLNHRTFQEKLAEALKRSQRYGRQLAVILTDIDHFKSVNDTYGHPVGDEVIRRVSSVLVRTSRATDFVARYGGEEFAVVMEETDSQGGLMMAERIRQAVQNEVVQTDMGPLKVTLSLGVAAYPSHAQEKHLLIERADQALYTAKHTGRNRAVIGQEMATQSAPAIQPEKA